MTLYYKCIQDVYLLFLKSGKNGKLRTKLCMKKTIPERIFDMQNSALPGVYETTKKDGSIYYRASFTHEGKHISLGSFPQNEQAHQAYLDAKELMQNTAITLDTVTLAEKNAFTLSLEKQICLLNLRDNHIYFSTPIYARKKYFYYFLPSGDRLTFDMDDLFFYASHKIMQRKGHLFVADYGMQLNIVNRYGIKNYGVLGRDYRFRNGDSFDFRYENIEILNAYHGVTPLLSKGKRKYKAQIHLKGNFVIGTYDTSLEAAIAYNKAIDIVRKNGITKNFTQNETEGITPSVYAKLYSEIKIPEKILNYRAE